MLLAYGFVARVLTGPTLSPLGQFVTRVLTPRLPVAPRWVPGTAEAVRAGHRRDVQRRGARRSPSAFDATLAARVLVALVVVAATLESVFALLPRLHPLRLADPARRHPGAHLRAVRRPPSPRRARVDARAYRRPARRGARPRTRAPRRARSESRRLGPYARSDGMPSRRLPPTFMPTSPCCQPGITFAERERRRLTARTTSRRSCRSSTTRRCSRPRRSTTRSTSAPVPGVMSSTTSSVGGGADLHRHLGRAGRQRVADRHARLALRRRGRGRRDGEVAEAVRSTPSSRRLPQAASASAGDQRRARRPGIS